MQRFCEACGASISPNAAFCAGCGSKIGMASVSATSSSGAAAKMAPVREEKMILDQEGITISNSRFIVNGQTYAMSGITSVRSTVFHPSKMWPILMILFGVWGVCAFLFLQEYGGIVVGLGILAIGILWLRSKKPTYAVKLTSSSGEVQACSSQDEEFVVKIVNAINDAIVHRG